MRPLTLLCRDEDYEDDKDTAELEVLAQTVAAVVDQYIEGHPETPIDEVAAVLSYVHGTIFRLASEIPPSKLH